MAVTKNSAQNNFYNTLFQVTKQMISMKTAIKNDENIAVRADNTTRNEHTAFNQETDFLANATREAGNKNFGELVTQNTMYANVNKYFDPYAFNQNFEDYIKKVDEDNKLRQKINTTELNELENLQIPPYKQSVEQILIKNKETWKNIVTGKSSYSNNDLFYIAITLIAIAVLYILLSYVFT